MRRGIIVVICFFAFVGVCGGQVITRHTYNTFGEFYGAITQSCSSQPTYMEMKDTLTTEKRIAPDVIEQTQMMRLDDWRIKFVSYKDTSRTPAYYDSCFVFVNGMRIIPDSDNRFSGLAIFGAEKIVLRGTTYLVLPSWAPACNGSFCRAEMDQLIQIKDDEVKYQIIYGWQSPSNFYCDLNSDGQLDQISFIGNCPVNGDSILNAADNNTARPDTDADGRQLMRDYFCIQALTLKKNKWVPLTDRNQKEYFIYLQVADFFKLDSFKVIAFNWMNDL